MAVIYSPTCPVARCSVCGVQRQFHTASDVPYSADRDHEFVAETVADFEPFDLNAVQLLSEIRRLGYPDGMRLTGWEATDADITRSVDCRVALHAELVSKLGISFDDLREALA